MLTESKKGEGMGMIVRCGCITGLIFLIVGIYGLLLAYRVVPLKIKDPEKADIWYNKFGKLLKILGPIVIITGILMIFGIL